MVKGVSCFVLAVSRTERIKNNYHSNRGIFRDRGYHSGVDSWNYQDPVKYHTVSMWIIILVLCIIQLNTRSLIANEYGLLKIE